MATRWEYLRANHPDLNQLGQQGWELVAHRTDGEFIFKRPEPLVSERFTLEQAAHTVSGDAPSREVPRLLNPELAALVRRIGHTQMLIVCDRGFPVPHGLPLGLIDLSVTTDVPTIPQVLGALLPELPLERILIAREMQQCSPERWAWHHAQRAPVEEHPHLHFKHLASQALACIRTGDATAYGNVIIVGG